MPLLLLLLYRQTLIIFIIDYAHIMMPIDMLPLLRCHDAAAAMTHTPFS
jgi:hypothetical protein